MPSVWRNANSVATATNLTQLNTTTNYTVAFWAKLAVDGDVMRHASTANGARDGYAFTFNAADLQARHFFAATSSNYTVISGGPWRNGRWQHFAIVYNGSVANGFINGVLRGRTTANPPTANASCTTTLTPAIAGTFNGNLFDFQLLPGIAVPLADVPLLMNPRFTYPGIKARWFGLEFTGVGPSSTLRDESGNGSNLTTTATGVLHPDAEPPYLPTLG